MAIFRNPLLTVSVSESPAIASIASLPITTFSFPPRRDPPAAFPTATFFEPVVSPSKLYAPRALLLSPCVNALNTLNPIPVFVLAPFITPFRAFVPITVLLWDAPSCAPTPAH